MSSSFTPKTVTLDEAWLTLDEGLSHLLNNLTEGFSMKEYMKAYSAVYDYCTTPKHNFSGRVSKGGARIAGEELYYRLENFLQRHMKSLLKTADTRMDDSLLNYYKKEWDRYTTALRVIHKIFQYINRYWVPREIEEGKKEVYEVYTLAVVIWKKNLFDPLNSRLTSALLALIEKDRNGEQIDTSLVKGCIDAYVHLGIDKGNPDTYTLNVYLEGFFSKFLKSTEVYYGTEANDFVSKNSVSDYMKQVENRLNQEKARVRSYLHPSSQEPLLKCCEKVLLEKFRDSIWNEFPTLLKNDKTEDISRMFSLLCRLPQGVDPLKDILEKYVRDVGIQSVSVVAKQAIMEPRLYVDTILKVHAKYNNLVKDCFQNDSGFVAALDKACRRFINDNDVTKLAKTSSKSPELLAKYCDVLLKKSPKNPEEQEILNVLDDLMLVFKYIEDKDVFQTFYSKMLAKRLINGNSASDYLEGQMIAKLKQNCGYEYTAKLARMFNDMSLSRDLLENFKNHSLYKEIGGIDFVVFVLATGSWPLQPPSTNFSSPPALTQCQASFQKFYHGLHQGRKLTWLLQFSKGELRSRFVPNNKTGYIFQCSTYQLGVLLQFNEQDEISTDELATATSLTKGALSTTLATLLKTRVLLVSPSNGQITGKHKFRLNTAYKNRRARVLINVRLGEVQQKDTDETHKMVEEDRKLQIQAAIVRVMKSRQTLKHGNLMSEVISQLQNRFKPKISVIKKCIDILIEKEYVERVQGSKDTYQYVA